MRFLVIALLYLATQLPADAAAARQVDAGKQSVLELAPALKAGEYVWKQENAPTGPALLIVNLATQRAILFRNGVPIAASTVSTGRPGYETPTGVFTVLQKHVEHYSSKYDNAPMPYMQRLTWRGVALHAGKLPGYPASHGCIRLPHGFAKQLYGVTALGMTVIITQLPITAKRSDLSALAGKRDVEGNLANAPFEWRPDRASRGLTSVVISVADRRAIVTRNGVQIGSAPVLVRGEIKEGWAYVLHQWSKSGRHWLKLHFDGRSGGGMEIPEDEAARFEVPNGFRQAVSSALRPGSIVVVTPEPISAGNAGEPVTVIEDVPAIRN
ncbi:MAG TPA: L,D-transpeptidase family protein [Sphingomicrobium sp.]|nr:L,D-transpeptidase family protein [Sphingomicrobium sp.]